MVGSHTSARMYTVETILTKYHKPYLVEVNGCDSGLQSYQQLYGNQILEDLLRRMHRASGKKTIYSEHPPTLRSKLLTKTQLDMISTICETSFGVRYVDVAHKIGDTLKQDKVLHEEELRSIAQKIGIVYTPFESCTVTSNSVTFRRSGRNVTVSWDNIGLIWLAETIDAFADSSEFDPRLVNPYPVEKILSNKIYVQQLLSNSDLSDNLPSAVIIGRGMTVKAHGGFSDERLVLKPNNGFQAHGIRIGTIEEFQEDIKSLTKTDPNIAQRKDPYARLESAAYLLQQFIKSRLRLERPSVFRALIFGGQCIALIDQMRSLVNPLEVIGNEPPSEREKRVISQFSEEVIRVLEDRLNDQGIVTGDDFRNFRREFWKQHSGLSLL